MTVVSKRHVGNLSQLISLLFCQEESQAAAVESAKAKAVPPKDTTAFERAMFNLAAAMPHLPHLPQTKQLPYVSHTEAYLLLDENF